MGWVRPGGPNLAPGPLGLVVVVGGQGNDPVAGAGAGPRGHCRLAACPGDWGLGTLDTGEDWGLGDRVGDRVLRSRSRA
jgi:hypothetical protein